METNKSLFALSNEYKSLYDALVTSANEDGVIDENVFAAVEQIKGEFTEKAIAVATVYRALGKDIELFDSEIERLTAIKKRLENEQNRVKKYLSDACEKTGTESIKGVYANISFRKSEETDPFDIDALPDEYKVVKTTVSPDKAKIKAAIKAGIDVPGARLIEKRNIQIK